MAILLLENCFRKMYTSRLKLSIIVKDENFESTKEKYPTICYITIDRNYLGFSLLDHFRFLVGKSISIFSVCRIKTYSLKICKYKFF